MPPRRKYMADYEAEHQAEAAAAQVLGARSAAIEARSSLRLRGHAPEVTRAAVAGALASLQAAEEDVRQEPLTEADFNWSGYIAIVSAIDIFSSSVVSIAAFVFAYRVHGVSLACLGLQSVSHLMSSALLAIRFVAERRLHLRAKVLQQARAQQEERLKDEKDDASPKEGDAVEVDDVEAEDVSFLLKRQRRHSLGREQGLHVAMGVVMLLSSVGLAYQAYSKIDKWHHWYDDHEFMDKEAQIATEALAWYGFAAYLLQAVFRGIAAGRMRRDILWQAFSASVVSLIFLFSLGISAAYQKEWSWKAEPFCALILAMGCLIEGMRILIFFSEDLDMRMSFDPRA